VSGGTPLDSLLWENLGKVVGSGVDGTPEMTTWSAKLGAHVAVPFDQLFYPTEDSAGGRRATRARFPNGNPEHDIVPNGYTKADSWAAPPPWPQTLVQENPLRTDLVRKACPADACQPGGPSGGGPPWAIFCCFFWGSGATAENWTTGSFWATQPGPSPSVHIDGVAGVNEAH
jgi:hypothetical protein